MADLEYVQIGWWLTSDQAPEHERARYLALMGPMLQTYRMAPDDYWQLGVEEWDALYWWLVACEIVKEAGSGE